MVQLLVFADYLMSQQHASVSQGQIAQKICMCCHAEIEAAEQTICMCCHAEIEAAEQTFCLI